MPYTDSTLRVKTLPSTEIPMWRTRLIGIIRRPSLKHFTCLNHHSIQVQKWSAKTAACLSPPHISSQEGEGTQQASYLPPTDGRTTITASPYRRRQTTQIPSRKTRPESLLDALLLVLADSTVGRNRMDRLSARDERDGV